MDAEMKDQVWNKAKTEKNFSPSIYRKDACGAWIRYDKYGDRNSDFGWEIDHVYPVDKGGGDELINLRAMHWMNNVEKGNDYPNYMARVQAIDTQNVEGLFSCTVNKELVVKLNKLYGENQ